MASKFVRENIVYRYFYLRADGSLLSVNGNSDASRRFLVGVTRRLATGAGRSKQWRIRCCYRGYHGCRDLRELPHQGSSAGYSRHNGMCVVAACRVAGDSDIQMSRSRRNGKFVEVKSAHQELQVLFYVTAVVDYASPRQMLRAAQHTGKVCAGFDPQDPQWGGVFGKTFTKTGRVR